MAGAVLPALEPARCIQAAARAPASRVRTVSRATSGAKLPVGLASHGSVALKPLTGAVCGGGRPGSGLRSNGRGRRLQVRASAPDVGSAVNHPTVNFAERAAVSEENFLDSSSRWLWQKLKDFLPKRETHRSPRDPFAFLPPWLHERIHQSEHLAILVIRELILLSIAYLIIKQTEGFCRQLNSLWAKFVVHKREVGDTELRTYGFAALVAPIQFFTAVICITRYVREFLPAVSLNMSNHLVARIRGVAFVVAFMWFLLGWKSLAMERYLEQSNNIDKNRIITLNRGATLALIAIGTLLAAETFGVPLKSITAIGGISGIAIGLASKEVVTNFFGGFVLVLTRPFIIGEAIKAGQFSGIVQDIGFFQTKLLGFDKNPITVPNQVFTNMVITNMSRSKNRVFDASFELRLQDILLVDSITAKITDLLKSHAAIDHGAGKPVAYLKAIKEGSLTIALSATARAMGSADFYAAQQQIFVRVANIIVEEGAAFGANGQFPPKELQSAGAQNGAPIAGVPTTQMA